MKLFITVIVLLTLINGCAAVRMMGKISSATGDIMVNSANEEEAKQAKLKKEGKVSDEDDDEKEEDEDEDDNEDNGNKSKNIVSIKKSLTSVRVRSKPSTKNSSVMTLTGSDKVEKIGEKGDWLNIRFNVEGNQGEGWIKKDLVEK